MPEPAVVATRQPNTMERERDDNSSSILFVFCPQFEVPVDFCSLISQIESFEVRSMIKLFSLKHESKDGAEVAQSKKKSSAAQLRITKGESPSKNGLEPWKRNL